VYIASKVLAYLAFPLGLAGIYAGAVRLLCYSLQCPMISLPFHRDLILSVFPLLIISVGSLLSPAYFTYPPTAALSYLLAATGILYASAAIANITVGATLPRLFLKCHKT